MEERKNNWGIIAFTAIITIIVVGVVECGVYFWQMPTFFEKNQFSQTGFIEGTILGSPRGGCLEEPCQPLPKVKVCAENIEFQKLYCVTQEEGTKYRLEVPVGSYSVSTDNKYDSPVVVQILPSKTFNVNTTPPPTVQISKVWSKDIPSFIPPFLAGQIDKIKNLSSEPVSDYQPEKLLFVLEISKIKQKEINEYFFGLEMTGWETNIEINRNTFDLGYRAEKGDYIIDAENRTYGEDTAYYYVYLSEAATKAIK